MGTKERRERERHDTRERILAAAREMFATEGYEAVTMRAIANRIEYTPTALYHHFPSKQALVTELCERDFAAMAKVFATAAAITDPVERMYAIGRAYVSFAEEHPSQYRFMFMTVLPELEHAPGYIDRAKLSPEHNAYLFLRDACQSAIDAGRLRPEYSDADLVAQIVWSSVHGLVSLRITKTHDDWIPWRGLRESAEVAMHSHMQGMLVTR
jgi:AcrR family transcriptional regulator